MFSHWIEAFPCRQATAFSVTKINPFRKDYPYLELIVIEEPTLLAMYLGLHCMASFTLSLHLTTITPLVNLNALMVLLRLN